MSAGPTTGGFTDIDRQHWMLRYLPAWLRPYGRLARWDRPIGTWLLMLPCWWSVALGSGAHLGNLIGWANLAGWFALFAVGAFAARGAGCTWNDIVDRDIDARVERTRDRPLPSGEVKLTGALVWMVVQSIVCIAVLFKLNKAAGGIALLSIAIVVIYPTMKRFMSWPQVVLGLAFNWGALVGYVAVTGTLSWATVALYWGGVSWTLVYDTIYAMQDQRDDSILDVRSTARRFGDQPRRWLTLFAGLALIAWALAGYLAPLNPVYYAGLLLIAGHFAWQIVFLKPDDQADCLAKFKSNGPLGLLLTAAIVVANLV